MARRDKNSMMLILAYGEELGVPSAHLLKGTGMSASEAAALLCPQTASADAPAAFHGGSIAAEQELQVIRNLLETVGDPVKLGVGLGQRYQLTTYGIIGYAMLSSPTLRKAITLAIRYLSLTYAFCEVSLDERGDECHLVFANSILGALGDLVVLRDLWAAAIIQRELLASSSLPYRLELTLRRETMSDEQVQLMEKTLGAVVTFNATRNAFVGPASLLDLPLPKGNAQTALICEAQCRDLLQQKQQWQKVSEKVRDVLIKTGLNASMEEVASALARTSRTLHRQLKEEGTSWRAVRDDVRMGLAEALLVQPISLEEIAERLGYSDGANFSHAFKRWKGISPAMFRKSSASKGF